MTDHSPPHYVIPPPPPQDPSALTTAQLHREVTVLHELMDAMVEGIERVSQEKFAAVTLQLELVERMRVEQKKDTKDAVDAALTAQKEAVKEQTTAFGLATAKSEAAMTEQLKQLNATFTAAIKGVTDAVNDVKDRVSRIESTRVGGDGIVANQRMNMTLVIAGLGFLVSLAMAVYATIPR